MELPWHPSADTAGYHMVPAFTVFNAAIGYYIAKWQLALNIINLTEKGDLRL